LHAGLWKGERVDEGECALVMRRSTQVGVAAVELNRKVCPESDRHSKAGTSLPAAFIKRSPCFNNLEEAMEANDYVITCWQSGLAVEITEAETSALIEQGNAPRYVPLSFGRNVVRILPNPDCEWAFRALAQMRGERIEGSAATPATGAP
jgi:hypothetical protein